MISNFSFQQVALRRFSTARANAEVDAEALHSEHLGNCTASLSSQITAGGLLVNREIPNKVRVRWTLLDVSFSEKGRGGWVGFRQ